MASEPPSVVSAEPTWEACKENVLPIKRGRSAKGLNAALSTTTKDKDALTTAEHAHETTIHEAASGDDNIVLLDAYIRYFKWVRDTYPSSTEKALKLLEQCTCELKGDATLRNDARFVKMWIEYADMVRTPGEIFSFMQSNKIGETVALFWVVRLSWSFNPCLLSNVSPSSPWIHIAYSSPILFPSHLPTSLHLFSFHCFPFPSSIDQYHYHPHSSTPRTLSGVGIRRRESGELQVDGSDLPKRHEKTSR